MPKTYLSLGSNIGDRKAYLRAALKILSANKSIEVAKVSSVYESEPAGPVSQRPFLNVVAQIKTDFSAAELLKLCRFVEGFLKRKRQARWGPRNIDVDILLYGGEEISESDLTIPHPQLTKRAFVLVPLLEISPQLILPNGKKLADMLDDVSDQDVARVGSLER